MINLIRKTIREAARFLPVQFPLHAFVTQNTLHAFEDLPFCDAVVKASYLYGTQSYLSEELFAIHLEHGRILAKDIDAVLTELGVDDTPSFIGGLSRRQFRGLRLKHLFNIPAKEIIHWQLQESEILISPSKYATPGLWDKHALRQLWANLCLVARKKAIFTKSMRARDSILEEYGYDTDELVHPMLIRLCAAFLDQGIAYWPMPERERGFLASFRSLYSLPLEPPSLWLRDLGSELRQQDQENLDPEQTIERSLRKLQIPEEDWEGVLTRTLMSLRGWAGMVNQLELRPDRAPVRSPHASLADYLAVQLTLDCQAAAFARQFHTKLPDKSVTSDELDVELVYEAFVVAQYSGIEPSRFMLPDSARMWLSEIAAFGNVERRKVLHLAFERGFRTSLFDSLSAHKDKLELQKKTLPQYQAVFCIDDREESMRRHLEEINPLVETFGYAGFFGIAMAYKGLADVRARPLCPIVVKPNRLIFEEADNLGLKEKLSIRKKLYGQAIRSAQIGSRSLLRGSLLSTLVGPAAIFPFIGRCLFPRFVQRWLAKHSRLVHPQLLTRLRLDYRKSTNDELDYGFTPLEMATIVKNVLGAMGLRDEFSPLFFVVGHGSSSLNNPHKAAYNCGATGGGSGGPNARALAAMANRRDVRELLTQYDLTIPSDTWFVGAVHNTCDDSVEYFDEDLIPTALTELFRGAQEDLLVACEFNAHERVRRFEESSAKTTTKEAHKIARSHAFDLAQPRPEYGHNTNAICFVGRRATTKSLFLDRRSFLVSYDSSQDPEGSKLSALLNAACPVGLGINLEYYFSHIDPLGYGSGTKLPHNIVGLIGVMDGSLSDLRTGLPWQAVEIHEPVRLLVIVEAEIRQVRKFLLSSPYINKLVTNSWINFAIIEPNNKNIWYFTEGEFSLHKAERYDFKEFARSRDHYQGHNNRLEFAHITRAQDHEDDNVGQ